jgi:DNA polymerase III epsilon subunit-like protein
MIDLETLATTIDANILTIGAIKFDPYAKYSDWKWGEYPKNQVFYRRVDPESGSKIGLRNDDETIAWWSQQTEEVKAEAFGEEERYPIDQVMKEFYKFCLPGKYFWAHGVAFDTVICEQVFKKLKRGAPWMFYNLRDTRTLFDITDPNMPGAKYHHHALYDCWRQIVGVQNIYSKIQITA